MTNVAIRQVLPSRREGETFELEHGGHRYAVTIGYFAPPSRGIAEVFIHGQKTGTDLESVARDAAVILSISLQYGVPLAVLCEAITRTGQFVARAWSISAGSCEPVPTDIIVCDKTLDGLRKMLPPGLARLPRAFADDKCVVESWI
jgi:hypothetical protein